jgi:hypothetical protein
VGPVGPIGPIGPVGPVRPVGPVGPFGKNTHDSSDEGPLGIHTFPSIKFLCLPLFNRHVMLIFNILLKKSLAKTLI